MCLWNQGLELCACIKLRFHKFCPIQVSPTYGPWAKSGPRTHFIRSAKHFLSNKKHFVHLKTFFVYEKLVDLLEQENVTLEMPRPLGVRSSGSPLKVLKQSANNFFSGDVIPGRYGSLQSARQLGENFCFWKVLKSNKKMFCCCSLHFTVLLMFCFTCSLVSTQTSELCYESIKATNAFIYSLSLSPGFRQKLSSESF